MVVLVKVAEPIAFKVCSEVRKLKGVELAIPVFGRWDLVVVSQQPSTHALLGFISKLSGLRGVRSIETLIEAEIPEEIPVRGKRAVLPKEVDAERLLKSDMLADFIETVRVKNEVATKIRKKLPSEIFETVLPAIFSRFQFAIEAYPPKPYRVRGLDMEALPRQTSLVLFNVALDLVTRTVQAMKGTPR